MIRRQPADFYLYTDGIISQALWNALSRRRREVMFWRLNGYKERDISGAMGITERAVWGYRVYAFRKWKELGALRPVVDIRQTTEYRKWKVESYALRHTEGEDCQGISG